jgi:hypothetical protein
MRTSKTAVTGLDAAVKNARIDSPIIAEFDNSYALQQTTTVSAVNIGQNEFQTTPCMPSPGSGTSINRSPARVAIEYLLVARKNNQKIINE